MKKSLNFGLLLLLFHVCVGFENESTQSQDSSWDYLVYSQRWPITACAEWEEKNPHNTCSLPSDRTLWTVHGIWPNKIGTDGPFFCPSSIHFDPTQLQPILDDMKAHWTNVEANTKMTSFWNHEWDKHGTCASSLPELNSVFNYFNQGLGWNQKYDMALLLANGGVVPGEKPYTIQDVNDVILGSLSKKPQIFCQIDSKTKESLISEIRICFDKNLTLIDCIKDRPIHINIEDLEDTDEVITNCKLDKPVRYYADLPMTMSFSDYPIDTYFIQRETDKKFLFHQLQEHVNFEMQLAAFLKFINFLIWVTI